MERWKEEEQQQHQQHQQQQWVQLSHQEMQG